MRGLAARLGASRAAPASASVSLFCYDNPALPRCSVGSAIQPTLLLATPGHAAAARAGSATPRARAAATHPATLPTVDRSIAVACDLNFVRGEDSAVRAMWAGAPFVWQFYRSRRRAHRQAGGLSEPLPADLADGPWRAWNGTLPSRRRSACPPQSRPCAWRSACSPPSPISAPKNRFRGRKTLESPPGFARPTGCRAQPES